MVLQAGRIERTGTPFELYDTHANSFVAQFIGSPSMNIFGALVLDNGMQSGVDLPAGLAGGKRVQIGKRPEDIVASPCGLEALVKVVEPTGSEIFARIELGGIEEDKTLGIDLSQGPTHFFDADSGQRIQSRSGSG